MKTALVALLFALAPVSALAGTTQAPATADAKDNFRLIKADELAAKLNDKSAKVAVYDANQTAMRDKEGIIPGAKLLSSFKDYDLKELPADKTTSLVFYCANTQCMASHAAAAKASDAGFKDVAVMSDGIMGWKAAGHPSAKAPNS
jgi:rhodanese-related sulfurtransferase